MTLHRVRSRLGLVAVGVLVAWPAVARADWVPPVPIECSGKFEDSVCSHRWWTPTGAGIEGSSGIGAGRCVIIAKPPGPEPLLPLPPGDEEIRCRLLAAPAMPGVTYTQAGCLGKPAGATCTAYPDDREDRDAFRGICTVRAKEKLLACDHREPLVASPPSVGPAHAVPAAVEIDLADPPSPATARAPVASPSPSPSTAAPVAAQVHACGCHLPGAPEGSAGGLVALAALLVCAYRPKR